MPVDVTPAPVTRSHRVDSANNPLNAWGWPVRLAILVALSLGFVLFDASALDLGPVEARLGLAAGARLAPVGRVFGGWEPTVWPAELAPSLAWAWGEGGMPTTGAVRWPAAIAAVMLGLVLSRRTSGVLGGRAAVLVATAWLGSLGVIDRSAATGLDLILGLFTVLAVDRVIARGSDLLAGFWLAMAFLAGGWPPVALVLLAMVVIGRSGGMPLWKLWLPPLLAMIGWSAWALKVAPAEVWGAALTLPLTRGFGAWLVPGVLALGLPFSPLALGALGRRMREGWDDRGRSYVVGWLQVVGVCLIAGTLVPGLASAAKVPALAGLAIASGAVADRLIAGTASTATRRRVIGFSTALAVGWMLTVLPAGGYLSAAMSYYRVITVEVMIASVLVAIIAVVSASRREPRGALLALAMLAVLVKVAHSGYYVHETNYRRSQGPWGRAIGQWVPPNWTLYTTHAWNSDLAFYIGKPVRQLISAHYLEYQPGGAKFLLLLESEFDNWPENEAKLQKVATLQDEHGGTRIVARTAGELPWTRPKPSSVPR